MPRNDARPPASKTIEQHLAEAEAMIHEARSRMGKALGQLRLEQAGFPSGGDGGGSSNASGLDRFLDPNGKGDIRDPARDVLVALTRDARQIHSTATAVYSTAITWSRPSAVKLQIDDGDQGCEVVARIKRGRLRGLSVDDARVACKEEPRKDDKLPVYEPTHVNATRGPKRHGHPTGPCDPATCEEPHELPRSYRLGEWAYVFVRNNLRLPTLDETLEHLRGKKVRPLQPAGIYGPAPKRRPGEP